MRFSELEPKASAHYLQYIHDRWAQLNELAETWQDRAIKFLIFSNGAGAAAVLAFMGAESVRQMAGPRWALLFFFIGLVFVGSWIAFGAIRMDCMVKGWNADSAGFFKDELQLQALYQNDERRVDFGWWVHYVLGFSSFGCLIAGGGIGVWSLLG